MEYVTLMISHQSIRENAERKYQNFLQAFLLFNDKDLHTQFFPIEISLGLPPQNIKLFHKQVKLLKDNQSAGYTLRFKQEKIGDTDNLNVPTHAIIKNREDYIRLIDKEDDFANFVYDVNCIGHNLGIYPWMRDNIDTIIENAGHWEKIVQICDYFKTNPQPNCYLQQLPIPIIDTKFIKKNLPIVDSMLKHVLSEDIFDPEAETFEERYGVLTPPPRIRFSVLDQTLFDYLDLPFNDIDVSSLQIQEYPLNELSQNRCIIVENQVSYLTLPVLPGTFAIFGNGMDVLRVRSIKWIKDCPVYYWGDLDIQGFYSLSRLRKYLPHVKSLLMDEETLHLHEDFLIEGNTESYKKLKHLNPEEERVFNYLKGTNQRLEQERLDENYVLHQLEYHLFGKK